MTITCSGSLSLTTSPVYCECGPNVWYRRFGYGTHQLRHNWTTLTIQAGVPFMEQRLLMTHAVPGIGQIYTHPEALVEHVRQYAEAIEILVGDEVPTLLS